MSYRDTVVADSPVAYWRLGDGPTTAADEMGSHHGTYNGSPGSGSGALQASGDDDGAMWLDGSNDYVKYDDLSSILNAASGITLEAWVYSGTSQSSLVIGHRSDGGGYRLLWNSDQVGSLIRFSGGFVTRIGGAIPMNQWNHIVATTDGTTRRHYLNGEEVQTWSGDGTIDLQTDSSPAIGRHGGGFNGGYFTGRIDEVAIYDHTLSAAQILEHYNVGIDNVAVGATISGEVATASADAPTPTMFFGGALVETPVQTATALAPAPAISTTTESPIKLREEDVLGFLPSSLAISDDGRWLMMGSRIAEYDQATGTFSESSYRNTSGGSEVALQSFPGTVRSAVFSRDGTRLAVTGTSSGESRLVLYEYDGDWVRSYYPNFSAALSYGQVEWSMDDELLLVGQSGDIECRDASDPSTVLGTFSPTVTQGLIGLQGTDYILLRGAAFPRVEVWKRSGDTYTKVWSPNNVPDDCLDAGWSVDGHVFALLNNGSLWIWNRDGETFTEQTSVLVGSSYDWMEVSQRAPYLVVRQSSSPYIDVYSIDGTTLTDELNPTVTSGPMKINHGWMLQSDDVYEFTIRDSTLLAPASAASAGANEPSMDVSVLVSPPAAEAVGDMPYPGLRTVVEPAAMAASATLPIPAINVPTVVEGAADASAAAPTPAIDAQDGYIELVEENWPRFWMRFAETDPSDPAVSMGGTNGTDGTYQNFVAGDLDGDGALLPIHDDGSAFFDGVDNYVTLDNPGGGGWLGTLIDRDGETDTDTNQVSFSLWVRPSSFGSERTIIKSSTNSGFALYIDSGGNFNSWVNYADGAVFAGGDGSSLNLGEWNHVAVVHDGSTAKCFVNGVQTDSFNVSGKTLDVANNPIDIGRRPDGTRYFHGDLDELIVFPRALSTQTIEDLIAFGPAQDETISGVVATASADAPDPSVISGFATEISAPTATSSADALSDARLFIKPVDASAEMPAPEVGFVQSPRINVGDPMAGAEVRALRPERVLTNEVVHEIDFSDFVTGNQVGEEPFEGWRDAFGPATWNADPNGVDAYNATVVEDVDARGGKYLKFTGHEIKWTVPGDHLGHLKDVSIRAKISANTSIVVRGGYTEGALDDTDSPVVDEWRGYAVVPQPQGTDDRYRLVKLKGTESGDYFRWWYRDWDEIDTIVDTPDVDEDGWIWVRFEAEGNQVRWRMWLPGEAEPEYWLLAADDDDPPEDQYLWGHVSFAPRIGRDETPPEYEPDGGGLGGAGENDSPLWGEARLDYIEVTEPLVAGGTSVTVGGTGKAPVRPASATVRETSHKAGAFNNGGGFFEDTFDDHAEGEFPDGYSAIYDGVEADYTVQHEDGDVFLHNAPSVPSLNSGALKIDGVPSGLDFIPVGTMVDGEILLKFRTNSKDRYGQIWLRAQGEAGNENAYSIYFGRGPYGLPERDTWVESVLQDTDDDGLVEVVEQQFELDPRSNPWIVAENAFVARKHIDGVPYIGSNWPNQFPASDGITAYRVRLDEWHYIRVKITNRTRRFDAYPEILADGSTEYVRRYLEGVEIKWRVWHEDKDEPTYWPGWFFDYGKSLTASLDADNDAPNPSGENDPYFERGWVGFSGSFIGSGQQDFDIVQIEVPDQPIVNNTVDVDNIQFPYSPYAEAVRDSSPVLWYRFDDESFSFEIVEEMYANQPGGSPFDIDPDEYPSFHENERKGEPSPINDGGYSIYFNGNPEGGDTGWSTADRLAVPMDALVTEKFNWQVNRDNSMSWEIWVKPDLLRDQTIFRAGTDGNGYALYMTANGILSSRLHFRDGFIARSGGQLVANEWQHVAMVFEDGERRHYINGVEVASWEDRSTSATGNQALMEFFQQQLFIGATWHLSGHYRGYLDEFAMYDRALTQEEIQTHIDAAELPEMTPPSWAASAEFLTAHKITVERVDGPAAVDAVMWDPTLYVVDARRLSPSADISTGGWEREDGTTTDLYDSLDEVEEPDYDDFIQSPHNPQGELASFTIDPTDSPGRLDEHRIKYSFRKVGDNAQTMTVTLRSAGALVATWDHAQVLDEWVDAEQELTEAQAASITDYSDLTIEITGEVA